MPLPEKVLPGYFGHTPWYIVPQIDTISSTQKLQVNLTNNYNETSSN